jgi:chromosome segregation ATPase
MTTDQITLHLCEVIAEQKRKINQLESSNDYLRESKEQALDGMTELTKSIAEKDLLIAQLEAKENETGNILEFLNQQIEELHAETTEQKETIETLQSSLKNLDSEYISLKFDFNNLQDENNGK